MQSINHGDYILAIDGRFPRAVQSVDFSEDLSVEGASCMGVGFYGFQKNGPKIEKVSIDLLATESGIAPVFSNSSGYIGYEKDGLFNKISWSGARLESYTLDCSNGRIPIEKFDFSIYSGISEGQSSVPSFPTGVVDVARPSFLESNIPYSSGNALQSISYGLNVNYTTKAFIGSSRYDGVDINFPIIIDLTADILVNDYEFEHMVDYCSSTPTNIFIKLKDCDDNIIKQVNLPSGILKNFQLQGGVGNKVAATFLFESQVNYTGNLI